MFHFIHTVAYARRVVPSRVSYAGLKEFFAFEDVPMLTRLAYLANYLLERDVAGRALYKLPDDTFLVAYPGSGGQWLRRLVVNLMNPWELLTSTNVIRRLPDLYHLSQRGFAKINRPRIIFSHECFDAGYPRAAYLVRDPRDVAVSVYEQRRQGGSIERSLSLEQFVSNCFMRTDEYQGGWSEEFSGSIESNQSSAYRCRLKHGFLGTPASWGENVISWMGSRGRDPKALLVLRYEDLYCDPQGELGRITSFLPIDGSPERIQSAVQATRGQATPEPPGKWRTMLPESAVRAIESVWGPVMTEVGYPLASAKVEKYH
jgi:Sulfotransferase domain